MPEEIMIQQCAPTLAGIKTGSLFSCPYETEQSLLEDVRRMNGLLVPKGLCLLPLRYENSRVLLYLYRPRALQKDLSDAQAARILKDAGYHLCGSGCHCLTHLVRRLRENPEFPHEIGLFLSYPPEDVQGFIDNKARDFKCAGLWKVYGDEAHAQALFAQYRECTRQYCALYQAGSPLSQLAVAG